MFDIWSTIRVNAVLKTIQLPTRIANLTTSLPKVYGDAFTLNKTSIFFRDKFIAILYDKDKNLRRNQLKVESNKTSQSTKILIIHDGLSIIDASFKWTLYMRLGKCIIKATQKGFIDFPISFLTNKIFFLLIILFLMNCVIYF